MPLQKTAMQGVFSHKKIFLQMTDVKDYYDFSQDFRLPGRDDQRLLNSGVGQ